MVEEEKIEEISEYKIGIKKELNETYDMGYKKERELLKLFFNRIQIYSLLLML